MVYMGSPEREEATFLFASSRYVLYLESTTAFFNIIYSSGRHAPHQQIRETLTYRRVGARHVCVTSALPDQFMSVADDSYLQAFSYPEVMILGIGYLD